MKAMSADSKLPGLDALAAAVWDWAAREPLVKRAFIFGSRARGDHRTDSDLDLAVEIRPLPQEDELTTFLLEKDRLARSLRAQLPVNVHLEWVGGTRIVGPAVRAEGILVFERDEAGFTLGNYAPMVGDADVVDLAVGTSQGAQLSKGSSSMTTLDDFANEAREAIRRREQEEQLRAAAAAAAAAERERRHGLYLDLCAVALSIFGEISAEFLKRTRDAGVKPDQPEPKGCMTYELRGIGKSQARLLLGSDGLTWCEHHTYHEYDSTHTRWTAELTGADLLGLLDLGGEYGFPREPRDQAVWAQSHDLPPETVVRAELHPVLLKTFGYALGRYVP